MKQQLLTALGSKVAIGIGATALAFGAAGTVIALQPASDSTPGNAQVPFLTAEETTTTTSTTSTTSTTMAPTTTTTAPGATATSTDHEHPDNFGKTVSEAAHARNAARAAAREADEADDTDDDHGVDGAKVSDDHRGDDHGQSGVEHGTQGRDHAEDED
jgi:hypothetical protein